MTRLSKAEKGGNTLRGIITDRLNSSERKCLVCDRSTKIPSLVEFYEIFNINCDGNSNNTHICSMCLRDLREPLEIIANDDVGTSNRIVKTV
jgi:hypothetical protein